MILSQTSLQSAPNIIIVASLQLFQLMRVHSGVGEVAGSDYAKCFGAIQLSLKSNAIYINSILYLYPLAYPHRHS